MNGEGDPFKRYLGAGSAGLGDWLEVAGENPFQHSGGAPQLLVIPCLLPMMPSALGTKLRFLGKEAPVSHTSQPEGLECPMLSLPPLPGLPPPLFTQLTRCIF